MWLEYESNVQALKSWMATQEERLKRKHRIEDLTSVQNALKDCQVGFCYCATLTPARMSSSHLSESTLVYHVKLSPDRKWKSW